MTFLQCYHSLTISLLHCPGAQRGDVAGLPLWPKILCKEAIPVATHQSCNLALVKAKLRGRDPNTLIADFERLQGQRTGLEDELRSLENDVVKTQNAVETAQVRVDELVLKEEDRKEQIAVAELEGDLIAINREMGFVIINVGSDKGVKADTPLLVVRGVDRIGRLRIVSVEPQVTVADIMPGSVAPGASLMVRDKVIFETR